MWGFKCSRGAAWGFKCSHVAAWGFKCSRGAAWGFKCSLRDELAPLALHVRRHRIPHIRGLHREFHHGHGDNRWDIGLVGCIPCALEGCELALERGGDHRCICNGPCNGTLLGRGGGGENRGACSGLEIGRRGGLGAVIRERGHHLDGGKGQWWCLRRAVGCLQRRGLIGVAESAAHLLGEGHKEG